MIPVSVLITTYNEEQRLESCLTALKNFSEIIVIDSYSQDNTVSLAKRMGAHVTLFHWDGRYPKKRQWCLNNITASYPYIFFIDADEIMTPGLMDEIGGLDFSADGYFVRSLPVWQGKTLRRGLMNNKLCLFRQDRFFFPEIDDLSFAGMGEMEGHYQPVAKNQPAKIEQLRTPLLHLCEEGWQDRHNRYARWEAAMIAHDAYPADPKAQREWLKKIFRALPRRDVMMFFYAYILRGGFLDGKKGLSFAKAKADYYRAVDRLRRNAQ